MSSLDSKDTIEQIDRHGMGKSIHEFSAQIKQAEEIGRSLSFEPDLAKGINQIVFSGLGGSAIGADFIRSYLAYDFPIPILVNRHYQLPEFVDKTTLLVASSYSGDTEETLSALKDGMKRGE